MSVILKDRQSVNKKKAEELKKSIKTNTNGKPINFHWKNDEAKEFIDFIVDESAGLLAKFRVVKMSGPTKEIARIVDEGKFLKPGGTYRRTGSGQGADGYEFWQDAIHLSAKKVEGMVLLSDDDLDNNIEGKAWETHVKRMVAKKIANEIIEAALYSRLLENPSGKNGILNVFNGVKLICERDGNVLDANSAEITRRIIVKAKKILKTKYRKEAALLMDSDIKTDIDELYNDPSGNRGNGETIKTSVSGMPITEVPLMNSEQPVVNGTASTTVSGTVAVGEKTILVANDLTTKLNPGDAIVVKHGNNDEMVYTVNTVTATEIKILETVVYELNAGDTVASASLTGADLFITNPKNIIVGIQIDITAEFERLAPDGYKVWYKMKQDIAIENPEAIVMVKNLKSKDL